MNIAPGKIDVNFILAVFLREKVKCPWTYDLQVTSLRPVRHKKNEVVGSILILPNSSSFPMAFISTPRA